MDYLILKWIHIISATILFGTGVGSAFFMFMANRRKNISDIYFALCHVVIADWIFTAPSVAVQFLSGIVLVRIGGFEWRSFWIEAALLLFAFAGACWLPVVWLQIQMRDIAKQALDTGSPLPARYWAMDRWWIMLGCMAFPAVVGILYLMVSKPFAIG